MRISDWSSDVCSSDLIDGDDFLGELGHCDSFRCGSGACPVPRKTVSRALRHKREILARNTLPMPDYFHVETRTCGVFLSAGRALAKRRGKTRPVLTQSPWERLQPGGLISLARLQKLATEAADRKSKRLNSSH